MEWEGAEVEAERRRGRRKGSETSPEIGVSYVSQTEIKKKAT